MDPEHLIDSFGTWALWGVAAVILIETGLLFPFLPGDSLLFTAGLFAGRGDISVPVWAVATILGIAALIGPQSGYWIGRGVGPRIFARPDSRLFKQAYVDRTHAFFDKYGGRAIVLGQFVPFVRTYIPVAAGVGKMPWARFTRFNVIGALIWGVGVTLLGAWLGRFEIVQDHIEVALVLVVFVSLIPIMVETIKHRRDSKRRTLT
jgi:membrane-associated protein